MPINKTIRITNDPVEYLSTDSKEPESGVALCLSGGGYRAMVFHAGVIWRLYETGMLAKLDRVSSVSGGSITAAVLGLVWDRLKVDAPADLSVFTEHFIKSIRNLAGETIDAWGIVGGILLPGTISEKIQESYRKHLFGDATLQDLVDKPRFVINAINVQSGVLWRFSKPYMRDYRLGEVKRPRIA
jgi:NTE family protein